MGIPLLRPATSASHLYGPTEGKRKKEKKRSEMEKKEKEKKRRNREEKKNTSKIVKILKIIHVNVEDAKWIALVSTLVNSD